MAEDRTRSLLAVKILAVLLFLFGLFAFFGSLFLWGEGFILQFPEGVDLSFPVADILVNAPGCIVASVGLWKLRRYGYVAAQIVAGIFMYGSVKIFVGVVQGGLPSTVEIIGPQVVGVIVAIVL